MSRKQPLLWPLQNATATWLVYTALMVPLALFASLFIFMAIEDRNGWYALVGLLIGYLAWDMGKQALLWWRDRK